MRGQPRIRRAIKETRAGKLATFPTLIEDHEEIMEKGRDKYRSWMVRSFL